MFRTGLTAVSANPGADFYTAITPALLGGGLTFIETIVVDGITHSLWRASAVNSFGSPWVLGVAYYATGMPKNMVWFHVYESYNEATNKALNGPINPFSGASFDVNGSGSASTPTDLNDPLIVSPIHQLWSGTGDYHYGVRISDQPFVYWLSVTTDRLILMTSVDARRMMYAGLYKPAPPWAATQGSKLFPLGMGNVTVYGGSESDWFFVTRYMQGKTNITQVPTSYQDLNQAEIVAPPNPEEKYKSVGGPRLHGIYISSGFSGWIGEFYGLRTVSAYVDFNIGAKGMALSRGDVLDVTNSTDLSSTIATEQWVAGTPAIFNNEMGLALVMKME